MSSRCAYRFWVSLLPITYGLLCTSVLAGDAPVQAQSQPNVIVFLVDDMGLMDTSVPMMTDSKGKPRRHPLNEWYRTPNMERLAKQGIRFSNFYAHSVCSPTRVSIMTGQNAARHRSTNFIGLSNTRGRFGPQHWNYQGLNSRNVTLPGILRKAGYRTIHIGKAHFGPKGSEGADPRNLGFDVNIGGAPFGAPGSYYGKDGFGHIKGNRKRAVPDLKKYHGKDIFLTEALTREAVSQIDASLQSKKPFYLYMSHYAVHAPFQSDPRFKANYDGANRKAREVAFATLIEGMDKSLGDLMDHVAARGIAEDTVIFFLGDNGSDSPSGGPDNIGSSAPIRGKKGSLWEGGTRVPFIAAWATPNADSATQQRLPIKANAVQTQTGICFDLFPTIAELAEARVPKNHTIDGLSLKTLLTGSPDNSRDETFLSHFPHEHRSDYFTTWRNGNWKLVYRYPIGKGRTDGSYSLFNLSKDLSESRDLATTRPEMVSKLAKEMMFQMKSMKALFPARGGNDLKPPIAQSP